jgi:hypothetical protein
MLVVQSVLLQLRICKFKNLSNSRLNMDFALVHKERRRTKNTPFPPPSTASSAIFLENTVFGPAEVC